MRPPSDAPARSGHAVVDVARWLREQPRPALAVPTTPRPDGDLGAGEGARVALLDGRVDVTHPDLCEARVRTWPASRMGVPDSPTEDTTARASLLVGQGVVQVRGLAPAAELLTADVRGPDGECVDELLARAVRWALAEGSHILVIPFGRRRLGRRVATVLRTATAAGARVFAAAGALGPGTLAFPASVSGVVAVTGHDGGGLLPGCSVRADLAAPGRDVPAAGRGRLTRLQGSSAATVLAAGAGAALRTDILARQLMAGWGPTGASVGSGPRHAGYEAGERYRVVGA